jgi:hypothetical protein
METLCLDTSETCSVLTTLYFVCESWEVSIITKLDLSVDRLVIFVGAFGKFCYFFLEIYYINHTDTHPTLTMLVIAYTQYTHPHPPHTHAPHVHVHSGPLVSCASDQVSCHRCDH